MKTVSDQKLCFAMQLSRVAKIRRGAMVGAIGSVASFPHSRKKTLLKVQQQGQSGNSQHSWSSAGQCGL